MDLRLNEQQVMLRDSVHRFLRDQYAFDMRRADLNGAAPGKWSAIAQLGWPGAFLPEAVGGLGGSIAELSVLMEEMGRALYVGPFLSNAIAAAMLNVTAGKDAKALLSRVANGDVRVVLAHGEPGGRGFIDQPQTLAIRDSEGFTLTGRKRLVYDMAGADMVLVSAKSPSGAAVLLIDAQSPNLARRDYRTIDHSSASDLELDGVRAVLLGEGDEAQSMLDEAFYWAAVGLGAEAVGLADGALQHTMSYLGVRKQFGRALADFQVLQHRLSDMFVEVEHLRSLVLHALSVQQAERSERQRAALGLKILAGQVAARVAGDGLHLHGGMGMTDEMPISHYYRRARTLESQYGNSDYLLAHHARMLS